MLIIFSMDHRLFGENNVKSETFNINEEILY